VNLSNEQTEVHQSAMTLAKRHQEVESDLIMILEKVERLKVHRDFGLSPFQYATTVLKLDPAIAYALIAIVRKSKEVPELGMAVRENRLSAFKANRIVASLTPQNSSELIRFAETHSKNEIEAEIARRNPRAKTRDRIKNLSPDWNELKAAVSKETLEKLERVESLLAQRGHQTTWNDILDQAADAFLEKNDPVRKAERVQKRKLLCPGREKQPLVKINLTNLVPKRVPLTAEQKRTVFLRDRGRCTHVGLDGKRCNQDRWVDIHHVVHIKDGGTNDPDNLTTLCWSHHDLIHQMEFPLDGAVTWLRSPVASYQGVSFWDCCEITARSRHFPECK